MKIRKITRWLQVLDDTSIKVEGNYCCNYMRERHYPARGWSFCPSCGERIEELPGETIVEVKQ